jgi:hypothetical protein
MRFVVTAAAAALLLAACTPAEAPAKGEPGAATPAGPAEPSGFAHTEGADLFGYYMPTAPIRIGSWALTNFHIADEAEFDKWEAGTRTATYGPVMLEFDDVTSPKGTNELGGEYHTVSERILPDAYSISGSDIVFVDNDSKLGKVTFRGKLDLAAIAAAKRENAETQGPVMTGTLTVGTQTFENVGFTWFGGD